jgi:hypothetical protein
MGVTMKMGVDRSLTKKEIFEDGERRIPMGSTLKTWRKESLFVPLN